MKLLTGAYSSAAVTETASGSDRIICHRELATERGLCKWQMVNDKCQMENDPVVAIRRAAEHLPRIDALAPFRTALLEFQFVIDNAPTGHHRFSWFQFLIGRSGRPSS